MGTQGQSPETPITWSLFSKSRSYCPERSLSWGFHSSSAVRNWTGLKSFFETYTTNGAGYVVTRVSLPNVTHATPRMAVQNCVICQLLSTNESPISQPCSPPKWISLREQNFTVKSAFYRLCGCSKILGEFTEFVGIVCTEVLCYSRS